MRTFFVTGIGTDVGKTFISCILVEALKADYWKPVQTGNVLSSDAAVIRDNISNGISKIHPETCSFRAPLSPHAAAKMEGAEIRLSDFRLPETSNVLIIEGAGGLMVPLNNDELMIDMIRQFDAEVILVIMNYLGSINHSLLSIEALKSRSLKVAGIIFNGETNPDSEDVILKFSGWKCLGRVGKEKHITKQVVLKYANTFSFLK